ncbi:MAG: hypothetical protein WBA89_22390 [Microcoleus sp.]|uniref:hypothetical protein n=1 Tax=Microcoleus sp. TaxID=44472 RepID=UPI003C788FA9
MGICGRNEPRRREGRKQKNQQQKIPGLGFVKIYVKIEFTARKLTPAMLCLLDFFIANCNYYDAALKITQSSFKNTAFGKWRSPRAEFEQSFLESPVSGDFWKEA